jgi:hypothetical protein
MPLRTDLPKAVSGTLTLAVSGNESSSHPDERGKAVTIPRLPTLAELVSAASALRTASRASTTLVRAELAGLKVNVAERRDQEVMNLTHQAIPSAFRACAFDELTA